MDGKKRWLRPPKLAAIGMAIAIGLFLSVASHSFGWSSGSTFVVACALVAVLATFGPALFLMESGTLKPISESGADDGKRKPDLRGTVQAQPSYAAPSLALLFPQGKFGRSANAYNYLAGPDDQNPVHLNRVEDAAFQGLYKSNEAMGNELSMMADLESDLDEFVAQAAKREQALDRPNTRIFEGPEEALMASQHG